MATATAICIPSLNFESAASYLSKSSSLANVATTVKLELYGLFKYITVSPKPTTSRPSIFDMTGRAKWDAWSSAGNKYTSGLEAEIRYIKIATELGWTESAGTVVQDAGTPEKQHEGEDIWDDDSDGDSHKRGGGEGSSGGLGVSVSSMAPPPEQNDGSIHGLAISNDAAALTDFFEQHRDTNCNTLDEFGYTPLHLAADRGNVDVVKVLLKHGGDPSIEDSDGFVAAELARIAGHDDIRALLI